MNLIMNHAPCHRCHDPRDRLNGILVMDLSMAATARQLSASMNQMLIMAAVMVTLTIVTVVLLMKKLILRRLERFMQATTRIREGALEESVPVDTGDEIGRLAESFNVMTGSLRHSLEELARQRQFLEDVINSIRDEIVVFARDGTVVTANQAGRERQLLQPGETCSALTRATFDTGLPGSRLEFLPGKDGPDRYLEIQAYPLRNAEGEVFQVIQVARDITERKSLEGHLYHSERLASLGLLASGFSHEINNPLASISAGAEGLVRRIESQASTPQSLAEMKEYLLLIRDEALRAKSITDRLLILSRPSGRALSLIDVKKTVSDTVSLVRYRASQAGIAIVESANGEAPLVKGDEPGLRQVLLNLLLNALEAIEGPGQIGAGVRPVPGGVEISVKDSGRGIAGVDLERVFEPFFSKRRGEQGTGLGLFIANSIVSQMGGRIEVGSEPGVGTEFKVFLPAA
jgi:two-component system NtrC family sensor kinase